MQMYGMSGELLGLIGQPEPLNERLPAWKEDFLSKPSVSIRKGIAWGFDSPYEDTDTLVLTACSGQFVDIRFPKDATTPEQALGHPSYWAFSGQAKTTFYDADSQTHPVGMPYTAHCVFEHDVDSRGSDIVDEGDMFALPNGDTVEMGIMINPATGTNQLYKEYWTSAAPLTNASTHGDSKSTTVAIADGIGIIIRVGGRISGILRDQSNVKIVQAGRWENIQDKSGVISWKHDRRNSADLPWEWLADSKRRVGDDITESGIVWKITEAISNEAAQVR